MNNKKIWMNKINKCVKLIQEIHWISWIIEREVLPGVNIETLIEHLIATIQETAIIYYPNEIVRKNLLIRLEHWLEYLQPNGLESIKKFSKFLALSSELLKEQEQNE